MKPSGLYLIFILFVLNVPTVRAQPTVQDQKEPVTLFSGLPTEVQLLLSEFLSAPELIRFASVMPSCRRAVENVSGSRFFKADLNKLYFKKGSLKSILSEKGIFGRIKSLNLKKSEFDEAELQ